MARFSLEFTMIEAQPLGENWRARSSYSTWLPLQRVKLRSRKEVNCPKTHFTWDFEILRQVSFPPYLSPTFFPCGGGGLKYLCKYASVLPQLENRARLTQTHSVPPSFSCDNHSVSRWGCWYTSEETGNSEIKWIDRSHGSWTVMLPLASESSSVPYTFCMPLAQCKSTFDFMQHCLWKAEKQPPRYVMP